jgi:ABC-type Fe3+-hydroxamate transport system substrate-binding protein
MSRVDAWNAVAASATLLVAVALADVAPATAAQRTGVERGTIASGSMVADPLLLDLCAAHRIAALTPRILDNPRYAARARAFATLSNPSAIEDVLALRPALLVVSHFANPQSLARLREHGIAVLDLGPMHGAETLRANVATIAALCGAEERGRLLAARFDARLRALGARVPIGQRPRGLYLAIYATKIFGGTRRTSYHDVLEAAGIRDAAGDRNEGWPELAAEQILALDPDLFVTKRGMGPVLCSRPGLELSRPCRDGRVVELEGSLIDDPGLAIADAAETLYEAVHGGRPQ